MNKQILKSIGYSLFVFVFLAFFINRVSAQTVTSYSPTKGSTPVSLAPGSPAGSYALSGFDTLNPYNLSMNFRLPLLQVGGRGGAGYTMMLPIQRQWRVTKTVTDNRLGCEACEEHLVTYAIRANTDWWHPEMGEFGPGSMLARYSGYNLIQGCFGDSRHWQKALTRLTFTAADGTEYEFRDQNSGGAPLDVPSCSQGAARGHVFVTADGSAATFISDTPIFDAVSPVPEDAYFVVSGYMVLRDGTRYRIDEGKVTWIRDRNGNQTRFEPGKIIDSSNREITYSHEFNGLGGLSAKQISFKGFNGASRTIRIVYDSLNNALRPANAEHPAETIKTYGQLFPGITDWGESGHNAGEEFSPAVISRVILPDGRNYRFFYNSYGELARVELPTGGAFEYDWTGGVVNMGGTFEFGPNYEIYRHLVEKRVYKSATALEGRTVFGDCTAGGEFCRQIDQVDPNNNNNSLLTRTRHYFFGVSGPTGLFKEETYYSHWKEGKEYKTELLAKDGTTVLQRAQTNWVQRANVSWWVPNSLPLGPEPANDPRPTSVTVTLPDVNKVSRQEFSYDDTLPYNNRSDVYEYDFGTGTHGPLLRRTHTSYVTAANYVGTDGLAVYAGTAAHLRSLPLEQWTSSDANGSNKRSLTSYQYDNYTTDSTHAALTPRTDITGLCTTFNSAGVCANSAPPNYVTRGNLTSVTSYLQAATQTGPMTVAMQYDVAGNMIKFLDPRSIASGLYYATTIDYADRYGVPDHEARADAGAAELNGPPAKHTYAFPTLITNPLGHATYSQFDFYLGMPVNSEDENGVIATANYSDALDRPTQVKRAVGTALVNQTTFAYDDAARTITTSSDRDFLNDNLLVSKIVYDQLGRTIEKHQYEGGSNFILTKTEYDALGRAFRTSKPYRPTSESAEWTTSVVDGLGRVISVSTPDGATVTTSYSGNAVTVTDQAGKKRKSVTDALGRLVEVYEDPEVPGGPSELNYQTTYLYDALDNLVKVTQGSQQRFFMYDSLNRLTRARNPEQGTLASLNLSDPITSNGAWSLGYQYDEMGNLTQKTDARGVVSTYAYDRLNRNTTIDYSDTASLNPDISRLYDDAAKGKGRLWSSEAGGTEKKVITSYDELGRPLVLQQNFKINGAWRPQPYTTSRIYNLAGGVTSQVYPSTRWVAYNYDAAGRLADKDALNPAFRGNLGGAPHTYSSGTTYSSMGALTMERFGTQTALYHKLQYNIRGQLWDVRVATGSDVNGSWNRGALQFFYEGTYGFGTSGPDNNGNVLKSKHYVPLDESSNTWVIHDQVYTYDRLNRLASVAEYSLSNTQPQPQQSLLQTYSYDRWGNRTIDAANTWLGNQNNPPNPLLNETQFDVSALPSTNRLLAPGDPALAENQRRMRYDTAGNLINDTYTGAGERVYDAENRMTQAWGGNNQWQFYTYNADGQRTRRKINNQETWQIYGFDGELLAEYPADGAANNPTKEYGYRNGQLLITATPGSGSDHSLSLSGANAWAQVPNSTSLNITGAITVEAWIKPNSIGTYQYIASRETYGVAGTGGGFELTMNNVGKVRFDLYHTPTTYTPVIGNTVLTTGNWHHIAGVWDGTHMRLYVNGVLDATVATGNGPASGTSSVKLGRNSGGGYFNGLIDEVRVSNAAVYSSNFTPQTHLSTTANTRGLWKFDGQVVTDSSSNGNHGTLQGAAGYSNDVPGGGGTPAQTLWLVSDHLGTPRIIVDQTGNRANVKRHDYLPFGEELFAGTGGRTTQQGYAGDGVRQQFTQKERDIETGLDYFLARYYLPTQGRFTGVDPGNYQARRDLSEPQSWNAYSYVNNSPLGRIDPDGRGWLDKLRNWVMYDIWGEEQEVMIEEGKRRQMMLNMQKENNGELIIENYGGDLVRVDPATMTRLQVFLWSNQLMSIWERGGGNRPLTPEDVVVDVGVAGTGLPTQRPEFFRGGSSFEVRPNDIRVDRNGLVQPGRGVSIQNETAGLERFGGAYRIESVPKELEIIQRGQKPWHFEIAPREAMTLERYKELLSQIKLTPVQ